MKSPAKGRQPASLLKVRAKKLRNALGELFDLELGHSNCLELVAREEGYRDWNTASAIAPAHLLTASDMLSSDPWQTTIDASTTGKSHEQLVDALHYVVKHVLNPEHPASFIIFSAPDEETYTRVMKLTAELIHEQVPGNFSLLRPSRGPRRLFMEVELPTRPEHLHENMQPSRVVETTSNNLFHPLEFLGRRNAAEEEKRLLMMGSTLSDATYSLECIFRQALDGKRGALKNVLRRLALNDAFLLVDLSVDGKVANRMSTPESFKACLSDFFSSTEQVRGIDEGSTWKERANLLRTVIEESCQALGRPVPKWENVTAQTFEDLLNHPNLPILQRCLLNDYVTKQVHLSETLNEPQLSASAKDKRMQADKHLGFLTMHLAEERNKAS